MAIIETLKSDGSGGSGLESTDYMSVMQDFIRSNAIRIVLLMFLMSFIVAAFVEETMKWISFFVPLSLVPNFFFQIHRSNRLQESQNEHLLPRFYYLNRHCRSWILNRY